MFVQHTCTKPSTLHTHCPRTRNSDTSKKQSACLASRRLLLDRPALRSAALMKMFCPHTWRAQRRARELKQLWPRSDARRACLGKNSRRPKKRSCFPIAFGKGPRWPGRTRGSLRRASGQELRLPLKKPTVELGHIQLCQGAADVRPARLGIQPAPSISHDVKRAAALEEASSSSASQAVRSEASGRPMARHACFHEFRKKRGCMPRRGVPGWAASAAA